MHSAAGVLARFNEELAETGEIRNAVEIALMQIDAADHTLTTACAAAPPRSMICCVERALTGEG